MWTYTRKHSIHKHPRTIHFDSFTIDIDEEGKVLSPITSEMEAVFKKHRAFIFEEPRVPVLAQYFASIDAAMAESLDEEDATSFVQLAQSSILAEQQASAPDAVEIEVSESEAEQAEEEAEQAEEGEAIELDAAEAEGEQQLAPSPARGRRKKQ